ncbi:putative two-component transcriptional regulator [Escherichia coli]|uniref:Putative two-component transcriptional regulator n=1 Tax=Escherichia coli TaxID=562 RepID=A0A376MI15_ECOLX|nr:putative two-component transcriptional regulator [Escherichia coli]
MSFSVDVLANIAIELQRGIGHQDRFQRLITTLRQCWSAMRLRCYVTTRGSLFRLPSTDWRRMYSVDALRWKVIHGWKRLPAPGTWCAFPQTANCPIPMTV